MDTYTKILLTVLTLAVCTLLVERHMPQAHAASGNACEIRGPIEVKISNVKDFPGAWSGTPLHVDVKK